MAHGPPVPEDTVIGVLRDACIALREDDVPFLLMGSIAAAAHGDERWPSPGTDVDLFICKDDSQRGLDALARHGFRPEIPEDEDWLVKGWRHEVLVDLIFRAAGQISLDDEMLRRGVPFAFDGHVAPVISPEDYVVMQACTHSKETQSHWFNALAVIERSVLDWSYLLERARVRPDRLLALAVYARSDGLNVPPSAIDGLETLALRRADV